MKISYPGIKRYFVGGKEYVYHRPTRIRVRAKLASTEFLEEIAAAEAANTKEVEEYAVDTLYRLCQDFMASELYWNYTLRVRTAFQEVLAWLPHRDANTPNCCVTKGFARRLRDKANRSYGSSFANFALGLIQGAFAWKFDNDHPVMQVRRVRRRKIEPVRERRRIAPIRTALRSLVALRAARGNSE